MTKNDYIDYALVRDALVETQKRRGFLTFEQKMALQHAEWASSDLRNGYKTESKVFQEMFKMFLEMESISKYPEIAAKLAEVMPLNNDEVRAVLASRRISLETSEIELILDIIKQNIGAV
jgi:DNA-directed RNA polymerase subunit F